ARASRGARAVVLCGGDGSYSAGTTEIARAWGDEPLPLLGFAPGGTVGTVPRALGVAPGGNVIDGIARVLHAAASDRPKSLETPSLRIESDFDGRTSTSIGFIFGTGLVARFFELYDARAAEAARAGAVDLPSGGAGIGTAAKIVARVFAESFYGGAFARQVLDPLRCDVEIDGVRLPWEGSSLVVSSVLQDLGLGMRVTWRGSEDPERPHVVVSGLSARALGPRMTRVLRGKPIALPPEPHFDGLARRFSVSFPEGPGPWVVDGDLRLARRVEVSAGPRLRLVSFQK
ncbi:MAG: hypothetical protein ACXVCJ_26505, partial [Polyangiales bacterium]